MSNNTYKSNVEVVQIKCSRFTSNTYLINQPTSKSVWLVDVGEIDAVIEHLNDDDSIKGLFLTHPHYDHIFCINELTAHYPDCMVYCSELCKEGLQSSKLNLSYYHEYPVEYQGENIVLLEENSTLSIFDNIPVEIIETPGHDWSCLTYKIDNFLFTGDSFIPDVKVVTKLRGGNKAANKESLKKISEHIHKDTIICPGHGEMGYVHPSKVYNTELLF